MYDILLISYGANGRLPPLFSYFIYFSQDQMCVSVRVYMCVLGQARAFMFCIGVSWHTRVVCRACGKCSFRVHIYCADKFASKMHHLYPLFLFVNTIKGTVLRRTKGEQTKIYIQSQHHARCSSGGSIRGARLCHPLE